MPDKPSQRPEGALIEKALKKLGISARQIAPRAELTEGRWRQIVNGYASAGANQYNKVRAPADTLARMAAAVGVSPEQLEEADRADAATELRTLISGNPGVPEGYSRDPAFIRVMTSDLPDEHKRRIVRMLLDERTTSERRVNELIELLRGKP
jgi:transcriptional regulator with XRE-family HTH domain